MLKILLFEDKLGITTGYESIWQSLLLQTGFTSVDVNRRNSFRSLGTKVRLLHSSGKRKAPGFNPDPAAQAIIRAWVLKQVEVLEPDAIIVMDPVILFMMNPDWDQATLDNLRGGVYRIQQRPAIVMLPISAWHTQKKETDLARLNSGFTEESEWEEEHGGDEIDADLNDMWIEPVVVPYGKFVLKSDLIKTRRILERIKHDKHSD